MLAAGVMGRLPLRINDGAFTNLDNAVTRDETSISGCVDKFDMSPLIPMVMNVVSELAQQNAFFSQDAVCLSGERRERVRKRVAVLLGRLQHKAESLIKILLLIFPLIGNVRRVVHNHVEVAIWKRHIRIVPNHIGIKSGINVHASYRSFAAAPKSTSGYSRVQNLLGPFSGIELKQLFNKFSIIPVPH